MADRPLPRVSPPVFPERWDRPARPADDALPSVADAHRQTGFQLGADLRLLHEGMNLQLAIVADSYPARYRTHAAAAGLMAWSRAFLAISDAATAVTRASYSSVPPLARMACECLAAAFQASAEELPAFLDWLGGALLPDSGRHATTVPIGQFMAGSTLVSETDLGAVYRAASEFSRAHFGVALVLTAPESNQQRLAVTFADQTFHLGWAEITLGWLLTLCGVALRLACADGAPYHVSDERRISLAAWQAAVTAQLATPDRARVEETSDDGGRRWLISGFRRQAGGAPHRIVL